MMHKGLRAKNYPTILCIDALKFAADVIANSDADRAAG